MIPLGSEAVLSFILFQDLMRPHLQAQVSNFDKMRLKAIDDCTLRTAECKQKDRESHHRFMSSCNGIINSGSYMSVVIMSLCIQSFKSDPDKTTVEKILSIAHDKTIERERKKLSKNDKEAKKIKSKWNPRFSSLGAARISSTCRRGGTVRRDYRRSR